MVASEDILTEVTRRLVEQFHPEKVILFGSRARETDGAHSDVDLIVLCEEVENRTDLVTAMHRAMWGLKLPCDILVFTPEEYRYEQQFPGSVARYASREGKVLYERAA